MDKIKLAILITIITISTLISGCIGNNNNEHEITIKTKNSAPIPIINAPEKAFFEEIIEFDASNSYDPDGEIEKYEWDLGDNTSLSGKKISHSFSMENYENLHNPIHYSVLLKISDNNGSWEYKTHNIELYPKSYTIYLQSNSLTNEKPISSSESFKTSSGLLKVNPNKELIYQLDKTINISKSNWNLTLFFEKPKYSILNQIKINLLNSNNEIIGVDEQKLKTFEFWNEKEITFNGKIQNTQEFKSIKLIIHGFSLFNNFIIKYGGEYPSKILFNFDI